MNGRERLLAAFRGEPVDRAPIWLREGFPVVDGPAGADDFRRGWQAEPLYRELYDYVRPHADAILGVGRVPVSRWCAVPWSAVQTDTVEQTPERQVHRITVATPHGELCQIDEIHRRENTAWTTKHMVESRRELEMLMSVPFEVRPGEIEQLCRREWEARRKVGERGIARVGLDSPVYCISGAMPYEMFLELSITDSGWLHEICEEVTRRILAVLQAWWRQARPACAFCFVGAEYCTPPMMGPQAFEDYVMAYEGRIVRWLKQHDALAWVHCHGRVAHALEGILRMGADATDPVEPPPAGDCTYAEAREIVGGDLTLMGNLEWDRLEHGTPQEISAQVRDILSHGNRRLVLAASAGPISAVTPRLVENYKAWIDTALECG